MNSLTFVKSNNFGIVKCDFYRNNNGEILMTREQIGKGLEYIEPSDAVRKLHTRHKKRLDKFSVQDRLAGTDGKFYMTYLYTAKGVYEICRWSHQPKADAFMDWVWDVLEKIRKLDKKQLNKLVKREAGKIIRKSFTDELKELPPSPHKDFKFMHYTNLIYTIIFGMDAGRLRKKFGITQKDKLRDYFTPQELEQIAVLECQVKRKISEGLSYKQIKSMLFNMR
ncbi:BRO family protein [Clostridium sp. WILCCON 0269]|uniref:BRO family protein n=1 Tax=Candidatus Clostridium eludens TaxID=3381663 RepID=A0ABW8SQI2_9CLOT